MSTKEQLVLPFPGVSFRFRRRGRDRVRGDDHASASEGRGEGGAAKATGRRGDGQGGEGAGDSDRIGGSWRMAIFAQCDPVALGRRGVENNDDRNADELLRALEMFTEWAYGKDDTEADPAPTRVIWDLPRRGERRDGRAARIRRGQKEAKGEHVLEQAEDRGSCRVCGSLGICRRSDHQRATLRHWRAVAGRHGGLRRGQKDEGCLAPRGSVSGSFLQAEPKGLAERFRRRLLQAFPRQQEFHELADEVSPLWRGGGSGQNVRATVGSNPPGDQP